MFDALPLLVLILIFLASSTVIWIAGIRLSETTDILSSRFHLGQALGGLILLAIATNLPEIAITSSASLSGQVEIAVGNILGGIGIQTVVLVALDVFGVGKSYPLTWRAASLQLLVEGISVIAVLVVAIIGTQLPDGFAIARLTPTSLLIVAGWLVSLKLVDIARHGLPWKMSGDAPGGEGIPGAEKQKQRQEHISTRKAVIVFTVGAVATLVAGVIAEESGNAIASDTGLSGVIFGSTFLAAATALPELSTGLKATKLGDYKLAISDIFGGNTFLPTLFLLADLLSSRTVLSRAQNTDIYLAGLGILLTCVYLWGLLFRPRRQILRMGLDSFLVLCLYLLGVAGLVAVAHG